MTAESQGNSGEKTATDKRYPELGDAVDLPKIDQEILAFWEEDDTFQASIDQRPLDNQFVFYDGPPFANGLPHYGHLLTGFAKDVIPRFQTMKGKRVERRFGWDTHGLPAELAAEADLGISGRKAVLDLGIDKFNEAARASVMRYAEDWRDYVTRQARWVDFENDYKTLDITFMESCLWAFKTLWDKGLIYRDYRVVPYSWAVESPLSNFETRLDNSYRNRTDPAITVRFQINDDQGVHAGAKLLVWTTTPWTLPSNLAAAVGPDITYAVMEKDGERLILSTNALGNYKKQLEGAEQIGTVQGTELVGLTYRPLFEYFKDHENAFRVLSGDFVVDDDGTGIVHMAPAFGEDDLKVCRAHGIELVIPVDQAGRYTAQVPDYEGLQVFEANKPIAQRLKETGDLFLQQTYDHSYPHCWRTDEPLIYMAVDSWYVRVTDFRDRMAELNEQINWLPGHVKDGIFGNWLKNAQDWNISRSRFWGTPIPVWMSDDPNYPRTDVYGSVEELQRDFGVEVTDLHRPFIDSLTRPNPDDPTGKSTMRRVEDVLDVWFDSGSMPFAQVHYPFENADTFEANFPANYIVEYVAQTRGWFYTLMVLSTALFDRPPFTNAICHGVVLDENRQKLSKRLRNYPDPLEFFADNGSDVMRWFLISSPVLTGGDLLVPNDAREIVAIKREVISPLMNAYNFFSLYANLETFEPELITNADATLDRYILTKTGELAASVDASLQTYDIPKACKDATAYCEALTNWYIRRSRSRFWGAEDTADKRAAFNTLYTALVQTVKSMAPLLPLLTEKLYQALTGERSVHLTNWPEASEFPDDHELTLAMDRVREACSAALAIRERARLRVRLPLKSLTLVHAESAALAPFTDLIKEEINVRDVGLSTDLDAYGAVVLKVNPKIGKRLGQKMKEVMAASKQGQFQLNEDGTATVASETLGPDDFTLSMAVNEGSAAEPFAGTGAVVMDVSVDEDQEREGCARDLIRAVQIARKDAGLEVSDKIILAISGGPKTTDAVAHHGDLISGETLAAELLAQHGDGFAMETQVLGEDIRISVAKAA